MFRFLIYVLNVAASTVIFSSASAQQRQPSLSSVKSYLCSFYSIDNIVNTTHQCIHSPVRLIKLNQTELEFGAKRRHKKKQTNKHVAVSMTKIELAAAGGGAGVPCMLCTTCLETSCTESYHAEVGYILR